MGQWYTILQFHYKENNWSGQKIRMTTRTKICLGNRVKATLRTPCYSMALTMENYQQANNSKFQFSPCSCRGHAQHHWAITRVVLNQWKLVTPPFCSNCRYYPSDFSPFFSTGCYWVVCCIRWQILYPNYHMKYSLPFARPLISLRKLH